MKHYQIFETIVNIIQSSLRDDVVKNIYQNYKIKNISGSDREIDIFVQCVVNGFEVNIAIECKDYANAVSVEKLEAFEGKCKRIPIINKKVFVTKSGYQKDAKLAAEDFGIDLYTLEGLSENEVKNWLQIEIPKPVKVERIISRLGIEFPDKSHHIQPAFDDKIKVNDVKIKIIDFVRLAINTKIPFNPVIYSKPNSRNPDAIDFGMQIENAFLIKEDRLIPINGFHATIKVNYTYEQFQKVFNKYQQLGKIENIQTTTLISEGGDVLSLVKENDKDEISIMKKIEVEGKEKFIKIGEFVIEKIEE